MPYTELEEAKINFALNNFVNSIRPSVGETRYVPVALDTYGIVAGSTKVSLDGTEINAANEIEYLPEGESVMTLSKVSDNFVYKYPLFAK